MKLNYWNKFISLGMLSMLSSHTIAAEPLWQDHAQKIELNQVDRLNVMAKNYRMVESNIKQLKLLLLNRDVTSIDVMLPMPDGRNAMFRLEYSPVYQASLEKRYPSIRTFKGYQIDNPQNRGRFDITPHGFHGMFMYNKQRTFIDPMARGNDQTHLSYYKKDAVAKSAVSYDQVLQKELPAIKRATSVKKAQKRAGEMLKTYRIAMAASGEYTEFHGGTVELAKSAIVTAMNRINEVYNLELSVHLTLVDNDAIIYTDAATDPFDNTSDDLDANKAVMNDNVGAANYDIGHVFNTGGGGVAFLGSVCFDEWKHGGVTGSSSPTNDPFVIDFVAHEIGHQFGGEHSFNGTAGNCGTRAENSAYEPGSGATIMAYAGICDEQNLQNNSDAMFHSHSIEQMGTFIAGDGACSVNTDLNNETPTVEAGNNYTIPVSTPFILSGSATDPDGDSLTYSWEQFDLGESSDSRATMVDNGNRPLFRAWLPTSSPMRYFPRLADVLNNTTVIGETYPTTSRTMTYKLMVRDGKGNTASDTMMVTSDTGAGPFAVTSPVAGDSWAGSATITWNTANTQNSPVDCANVDIMLSTDGGSTFDTTVIAGTANDGSETVTPPSVTTDTARLMVKCSDNIFFAVNTGGNFSVANLVGDAPEITGQSELSVDEDNSITVELTNLQVTDSDSTYPDDFTMMLGSGDNYTVNGQMVTPAANFNGSLSVPTTVNDGNNTSNTFNLSITVNAVNDAPMITSTDTLTTDEDTMINITLDSLTISDPDNASEDMILMVSDGDNYTLIGHELTPNADFNGSLTVMVKVSDGQAESNEVALSITVNPVNDAPVAVDDAFTVGQDTSANAFDLLSNDSDVDGDNLSITAATASGSGTVEITDTGVNYTPASGFSGSETISYTISDGNGGTADGTVSVTVTAASTGGGGTGGGSSSSGGGGGSLPFALTLLLLPLAVIRRRKGKY